MCLCEKERARERASERETARERERESERASERASERERERESGGLKAKTGLQRLVILLLLYVSSNHYMSVRTASPYCYMCVLVILLYMCPHHIPPRHTTTMYVSSNHYLSVGAASWTRFVYILDIYMFAYT